MDISIRRRTRSTTEDTFSRDSQKNNHHSVLLRASAPVPRSGDRFRFGTHRFELRLARRSPWSRRHHWSRRFVRRSALDNSYGSSIGWWADQYVSPLKLDQRRTRRLFPWRLGV